MIAIALITWLSCLFVLKMEFRRFIHLVMVSVID